MNCAQKVKLVVDLYERLSIEIGQFQEVSGLHCITGCGQCCTYPYIEASPLEFLPWAHQLFMQGQAEAMLLRLQSKQHATCLLYQPSATLALGGQASGCCTVYHERGLVCRLFGAAANKDKLGYLRLLICKAIKQAQPAQYTAVNTAIRQGLQVPVISNYYMLLNQIDFHMGQLVVPINQALTLALDEVLNFYHYHPLPHSA